MRIGLSQTGFGNWCLGGGKKSLRPFILFSKLILQSQLLSSIVPPVLFPVPQTLSSFFNKVFYPFHNTYLIPSPPLASAGPGSDWH